MKMTKEELFIESLYKLAEKQLKIIYRHKRLNRDVLLQEVANILLTYTIANDVMVMDRATIDKEYKKMSKLVIDIAKGEASSQEKIIEELLSTVIKETFSFYSYNKGLKDLKKIIDSNFKGKNFSERVWDNEKEVAKQLNKNLQDFLKGKLNVNQIRKDIEKTFNTSAYNSKRLVETEVNRCEDEAFRRFCKETGVKKIKRNEILDNRICDECKAIDGKIFDLDKAPGVIHPLCRGFNEVYE
jgi:SPP1 gp7 family putative phage head morphogenesis protein